MAPAGKGQGGTIDDLHCPGPGIRAPAGPPPGEPVPLRRGKRRVRPAPLLRGEAGEQWQHWVVRAARECSPPGKENSGGQGEERESPAPAQRAAESWGPLGKAGLALPAAPCPAAPGITSSDGRAPSPEPAACQRRRRRPASLSHNSAPRLRSADRCPPPEPVLTMVKVPREPLLIFFSPSPGASQGSPATRGLQTARSAAAT